MVVDSVTAEVADLVLHVPRILGVEVLDGVPQALALTLEQRLELRRVDSAQWWVIPAVLICAA